MAILAIVSGVIACTVCLNFEVSIAASSLGLRHLERVLLEQRCLRSTARFIASCACSASNSIFAASARSSACFTAASASIFAASARARASAVA